MEPLTALSIAAAVVQFVDFSSSIIQGAVDNYKSASSQAIRNHELATIAQDLSRLIGDVECKLRDGGSDNTGSSTPTYHIFCRLCDDCRKVQVELDRIFARLRPQGENKLALAVSSFATELKKVFMAGEISRLAGHLNQIRQQAIVAVLSLSL